MFMLTVIAIVLGTLEIVQSARRIRNDRRHVAALLFAACFLNFAVLLMLPN